MRWNSRIPAVQLRSVSARYRCPIGLPPGRLSSLRIDPCQRTTGTLRRFVERGASPEKLARLEAVLFLAREPLSSRKLSQYANLADGTEARTLVRLLNRQLDERGRAFRVQEVAGGFLLATRPKFARWLRRLDHVPSEERLSAPSMETLAVVAYRQPVMRAEIEAIRGVSCGEILSQLLNRDLVRVGGRSDELGRPYLYNTTKRFLQVFGLRSLEDLPQADLFCTLHNNHQISSPALPAQVDRESSATESQAQEDSDVSAVVEQERRSFPMNTIHFAKPSDSTDPRQIRMEDDDYDDDEYEDEEYEDEELEEEDDLEADEEVDDDELDDEDYEDEDEVYEDDDAGDLEDDELDDEEDEDEDDLDDEEYEDEIEEEEWEEVEADDEEEEEDDDEDWDDDDWEDDEDWEDEEDEE